MAFLHFRIGDNVVLRQHLTSEQFVMSDELVGGDLLVQRAGEVEVHACVAQLGDGRHQLEDLTHVGLQVNGTVVRTRILQDQDTFQVGHFTVVFVDPPQERSATTTRLGEVLPASGTRMVLRLDDGRDFRITASGVKVGRDESNDLVLAHGTVSGFHATIYQKKTTPLCGTWAAPTGRLSMTCVRWRCMPTLGTWCVLAT